MSDTSFLGEAKGTKGLRCFSHWGVSLGHKDMCPPELGGHVRSSCLLEAIGDDTASSSDWVCCS